MRVVEVPPGVVAFVHINTNLAKESEHKTTLRDAPLGGGGTNELSALELKAKACANIPYNTSYHIFAQR